MLSLQASLLRSGSTGGVTLTRTAESVARHGRRLVQLELELAALEVKRKVAALGLGVVMLVAGAALALFALAFALAAGAAGLATFLPTWLALLLVAAGLVVLAAALTAAGIARVKKGSPPVPELALLEAKLTAETLKNGVG